MSWVQPTNKKTFHEQLEAAAKRTAARKAKKPHCSYWYTGGVGQSEPDTSLSETEYLLKLNAIRRTISNFVTIVLRREIPVLFSTGKKNYAKSHEGKEQIVISATTDPTKFDSNCGATLHEASHLKWSKYSIKVKDSVPLFAWLNKFMDQPVIFLPEDILQMGTKIPRTKSQMAGDMKFIINVMEDRRIDRLQWEAAPGWRGYYDALYDEYWHTPEIIGMLLSDFTHRPLVQFYRYHICNMTNPAASPDFLPGLDKIWDLINLPNIKRFGTDPKWQSWPTQSVPDAIYSVAYPEEIMPDMIQTGYQILRVIYENAIAAGQDEEDDEEDGETGKTGQRKWKKGMKLAPADPNNLDYDDEADELSINPDDYTEEEFKELMALLEEMVDGIYEKAVLPNSQAAQAQALQESHATMKDVGDKEVGKAKCVLYKKLTESLMRSLQFPFATQSDTISGTRAVTEGIAMGNALANQITVLAEETTLKYTHQAKGHLDKRLIASLGFGAKDVFERTHILKYDPIFIHLTLDSSNSMHGDKWFQTLKLAVAMAKIAEKIRTIDLVISLRATKNEFVHVLLAYDSRVDNFNKITRFFPRLVASGGTPEGLAFDALKDVIEENTVSRRRKYFINISDGEPSFSCTTPEGLSSSYSGQPAHNHTRRRVEQLRRAGIHIMSYFIDDVKNSLNEAAFRTMYGSDARFINLQEISSIAYTLNKMMLDGERAIDK